MYKDGSGTGYLYTFDAEGRLTLAAGPAGGPYCYVYDANGLRVAKKSNATTCSGGTITKLYWRSIAGSTLAETDGSGSTTNSAYNEYVFFAGRRIAQRTGPGAIFYYFADHLGSTRAITTGSGTGQTPGQLCYDADFTPYGQEISYSGGLQTSACPPIYKFTGYERDSETGLDYAFARYYSSRLGRFLAVDPHAGSSGPQSLNAYSYVINNPLNSTDPSGLDPTPQQCQADPQMCSSFYSNLYGAMGSHFAGGSPNGVGPYGNWSCTADGVPTSCSMVNGLLSAGAAVQCYINCNPIYWNVELFIRYQGASRPKDSRGSVHRFPVRSYGPRSG